jgi:SAM-dependent methyltransferase
LYRRLPYLGDLQDIEAELRRFPAALELGCGTGRLCLRLQQLGLQATGVDESAEMLAHLPPDVVGIQSTIETLDAGRRWPAVLLPSHLINHPDAATRRHFVQAAHRHLAPGGMFFVKRHSPQWLASAADGPLGVAGGVALVAEHVVRDGDLLSMTLRYEAEDAQWTQSFTARSLTQEDIEALLADCGFGRFRWLGAQALWVAAEAGER